jgi:2-polyprenyl-3-methyl-5-hydroxy-6-metoxy-1,4-benzoquinol methylase
MTSNQDDPSLATEIYAAQTGYRNETVATQYDQRRFAGWRGRLGDWLDKHALELAFAHVPQAGGTVLDVPCGTGRITVYLAESGYKVLGADISAEMMKVARHRSTDYNVPMGFVQTDAASLPFRNDSFMCATAIRFMGHIPSATRIQILRELARVSRGCIIADYCVSHPITDMRRRLERWLKTRQLGFTQSWTWQCIPKHALESEFQAAGLKAARWFAKARFLSDSWMVLLTYRDREPS